MWSSAFDPMLTYLHIPSVFHNQNPCNDYRELYCGRNRLILPWKTTAQQGVAVRFVWIKIDVWLKLDVLNYSSRPKLSSGSAFMRGDVWPGPKLFWVGLNSNLIRPIWRTASEPGLTQLLFRAPFLQSPSNNSALKKWSSVSLFLFLYHLQLISYIVCDRLLSRKSDECAASYQVNYNLVVHLR